jgi:predicted nucleic acid-binding protein
MLWVADTGPVLHLAEAGALHLLPLLGEIALPPAVHDEFRRLRPAESIAQFGHVRELTAPSATQAADWGKAGLVDRGEAEAIALARQIHADYFLTDDAAARLLATTLGLRARGSLGVILWLAGQRSISRNEAADYLERLAGTSLWISPRIILEARTALKELKIP